MARRSRRCWARRPPRRSTAASHGHGLRSMPPPVGGQRQPEQHARREEQRRVFRQAARPASRAGREPPGAAPRIARNAQQSVAVQNRRCGASGTASRPPRPTSRVALSQIAGAGGDALAETQRRARSKVEQAGQPPRRGSAAAARPAPCRRRSGARARSTRRSSADGRSSRAPAAATTAGSRPRPRSAAPSAPTDQPHRQRRRPPPRRGRRAGESPASAARLTRRRGRC